MLSFTLALVRASFRRRRDAALLAEVLADAAVVPTVFHASDDARAVA